MDDGSQGIDDQFIKNAHGAPDLAGVAAQQDLGLLRRDRQVPRPRHAVQLRSGDRGHGLELAGVSHHRDQVDLAGDQLAVPRGRLLEQHRVLHQRIPRGHREAARSPPSGIAPPPRTSSTSAATRRPARSTPPRARRRSTGTPRRRTSPARTPSSSASTTAGARSPTPALANADLDPAVPQQLSTGVPLDGAGHRADPQLAAGLRREPEPRPRHLHSGQLAPEPADRQRRHPLGNR